MTTPDEKITKLARIIELQLELLDAVSNNISSKFWNQLNYAKLTEYGDLMQWHGKEFPISEESNLESKITTVQP